MKSLPVDLRLLSVQLALLCDHVMPDLYSPRPEWYEGLDSFMAEVELALKRDGEVVLVATKGELE